MAEEVVERIPLTPLGVRVDALRREKGWTWRELARRSGIHFNQLYKMLHQPGTDVRGSVLARLAIAFGLSLDGLLDHDLGVLVEARKAPGQDAP